MTRAAGTKLTTAFHFPRTAASLPGKGNWAVQRAGEWADRARRRPTCRPLPGRETAPGASERPPRPALPRASRTARMALKDEIKQRMFAAMKAQKTVEKEILRVATGEITMAIARAEGGTISEEEVQAILKKLVKSNREALAAGPDAERKANLEEEISIIESLLPKRLSVPEIVTLLGSVAPQIKAAAGPGPAMGVAMKALKAAGAEVDSKDVAAAIAEVRG